MKQIPIINTYSMKEITGKMYTNLYNSIQHYLEINTHRDIDQYGSNYRSVVTIVFDLMIMNRL